MSESRKTLFGTAGWSYEDWKGHFYPQRPGRLDMLAFAAEYFDVIEVNSTFYHPPSPRTTRSWVRRTAHLEGFEFTVKLHQRFTHQRAEQWSPAEADTFRRGIGPLADAGRLGGILVQFPWSFKNTQDSRRWLSRIVDAFTDYCLFVEVRHDSWSQESFFEWLDEKRVGFVDVDQPLFSGSLPPVERVTGGRGYVRLHGQNRANWFKEDAETYQRYDYLYSADELQEWVLKLREIGQAAERTYCINNNHYRAQAAANSLELKSLFCGDTVAVPGPLLASYPRLRQIARQQEDESQGRLLSQ